jgi:hypothetical protein
MSSGVITWSAGFGSGGTAIIEPVTWTGDAEFVAISVRGGLALHADSVHSTTSIGVQTRCVDIAASCALTS